MGKIKLIQTITGDIYFRCFFKTYAFMPYCDLPFMNPSFVPMELKDECIEYKNKFGKWPVVNLIEGYE